MEKNYFEILSKINVNDKVEQKNNLTYLSWAYAWGELKKVCPSAQYKVYESQTGLNYFTDGHTAYVKTSITVDNLEYIEYLPVMDYKNNSIILEKITSFDVNKAIQRALTKAIARHGLGLYIYAGEDLPEDKKEEKKEEKKEIKQSNIGKLVVDQYKDKLNSLNINIEKLAKYLKKNVEDLTGEDIQMAINTKTSMKREEA